MSRPEVKSGCSAAVGPESYRRTYTQQDLLYNVLALRPGEIDSGTQSVGRMHGIKLRANRRT